MCGGTEDAFARALVNSGRLSVPSFLTGSGLNTPDVDAFKGDGIYVLPETVSDLPPLAERRDDQRMHAPGADVRAQTRPRDAITDQALERIDSCTAVDVRQSPALRLMPASAPITSGSFGLSVSRPVQ